MRLANIRNGLAFPHDDVCNFQSNHGHHMSCGYFRIDAMPYRAVIHLLQGGDITVIDATRGKKMMTDAQKWGLATWCGVFNRAIRVHVPPCEWLTPAMQFVISSNKHKPLIQSIRKLAAIYGSTRPAVVFDNVLLECHQAFAADDHAKRLAKEIYTGRFQ